MPNGEAYPWHGNKDAAKQRAEELIQQYSNNVPDRLPKPTFNLRQEFRGNFKQRLQQDQEAMEHAMQAPAVVSPGGQDIAANPMEATRPDLR